MSIIERMLRQTAVYWAPLNPDRTGRPTWDAPVELSVRWEDRSEEFKDDKGEVAMSRAVVYVASDVKVKGVLMLGELLTSTNTTDPKANAGAWEVRSFEKIPNLRITRYLRVAML